MHNAAELTYPYIHSGRDINSFKHIFEFLSESCYFHFLAIFLIDPGVWLKNPGLPLVAPFLCLLSVLDTEQGHYWTLLYLHRGTVDVIKNNLYSYQADLVLKALNSVKETLQSYLTQNVQFKTKFVSYT